MSAALSAKSRSFMVIFCTFDFVFRCAGLNRRPSDIVCSLTPTVNEQTTPDVYYLFIILPYRIRFRTRKCSQKTYKAGVTSPENKIRNCWESSYCSMISLSTMRSGSTDKQGWYRQKSRLFIVSGVAEMILSTVTDCLLGSNFFIRVLHLLDWTTGLGSPLYPSVKNFSLYDFFSRVTPKRYK